MSRKLAVRAALAAFAIGAAAGPAAAQDLQVAYVPDPAPAAPAGERYLGDPRQLSKWARIADAVAREVPGTAGGEAAAPELTRVELAGVDLPAVDLAAINRRINATPYRPDADNWGVRDLWATPAEFARRGGDCEDYAIAKYVALRRAGVPAADLRIEVGWDRARADYHAALTVTLGGQAWLLDMDVDRPIPRSAHRSLHTIYTINETGLWVRG